MSPITVRGIGILGGFGTGIGPWAQALSLGRVCPSTFTVSTGKGPVELPALRADTSALEERVPARVLRRMDPFTRLGLLGAHLALEDAGLEASEREGLGLVVASGYGATATTYALLDSIIRDGDDCASPIHFANSLHNACAANIALNLGIRGPNLTVSQFDLSVSSALLTARQWLLEGRAGRVLFGAVDELSELTGYLWWRRTPEGAAALVPGEGAAFFLLSRVDEERPSYCTLERVTLGLGAAGEPPPGSLLVADRSGARGACWAQLRGSTPAGPAFDLAAAALMLKTGRRFPSTSPCPVPAGPLEADRIACLTETEGGFGWVEMGSAVPSKR